MTSERKSALILGGIAAIECGWVALNLQLSGWRFVRYLGFAPGLSGDLAGWIVAGLVTAIFVAFALRLPSVRANLFRPSSLVAQIAGHRGRRWGRNSGRSGLSPLDHELAHGARLRPDHSSPGRRALLWSRARRMGINGQKPSGRHWRHGRHRIFGRHARHRISPGWAQPRSLYRGAFCHQPAYRTRFGVGRHARRNVRREVIRLPQLVTCHWLRRLPASKEKAAEVPRLRDAPAAFVE
jgi:hypothetical protein